MIDLARFHDRVAEILAAHGYDPGSTYHTASIEVARHSSDGTRTVRFSAYAQLDGAGVLAHQKPTVELTLSAFEQSVREHVAAKTASPPADLDRVRVPAEVAPASAGADEHEELPF